jgi:rhodanese-related sulfurtransferase
MAVMSEAGPGVRVIDVRTPGEYFFHSPEVMGSELVPLADLPLRAGAWPKEQPVRVVCDDGRRSRQAVAWLRNHGFRDVRALTPEQPDLL